MKHDEHNNHRSTERRWERSITRIDNRPIAIRRIFCVTPSCGKQGELIDRTPNGMVPAVIERNFRRKGWEVGPDSSSDYCPSCVQTAQAARRAKRSKPPEPGNVVEMVPKQEQEMPQETAEAPQQISRADWRIIHAKLEEVYQDEDHGYRVPWSDAAVARDLGSHIPVAWVSQVREHSFGPAKDNEEVRVTLARVEMAKKEAIEILDESKKLRTEVAALVNRTNELMKRGVDVGKSLDGLLAIATRIEKAVR